MAAQRVVSATEFKAKCLALLDEVDQGGVSLTVTKRGRPVAVVGPAPKRKRVKSLADSWAGRMEIVGDIVNTDWEWDVMKDGPVEL
jgi:prevent-host-death family protein